MLTIVFNLLRYFFLWSTMSFLPGEDMSPLGTTTQPIEDIFNNDINTSDDNNNNNDNNHGTSDILHMLHERINQLEQAQHQAQAQLDQAHMAQQHAYGHPTPVIPVKEPRISGPPHFGGKKEEAMEFLLKCDMVFAVQPQSYATTESKLAFVINLLKDEAYRWVMPHLTMDDNIKPDWIKDWTLFREEFKKVFGDSEIIETARHKLKSLKQTGPATSYATEFRRFAAYLHYSDEALRHLFFDGLKEDVKDKILTPNNTLSIDTLIDAAIKWDNLLFQRRRNYSALESSV
jgi:hypothetical protein